ncbi:MAG: LOG family protein [Puniceicoccaceae bacterium]
MQSPTESSIVKPLKAYKNPDFLNSHDARPIRVLCELTEPETRLEQEGVKDTIVMFGSARNISPEKEEEKLEALGDFSQLDEQARAQCIIRKRQIELSVKYYREALGLSKKLTETALHLRPEGHDQLFHVCSGGGPGIMEAANRGAREAGGKSVALGISLPFEQSLNSYCDEETAFEFHYFFMRKYWFLYHAKALVVFPGGFGTMDELFEMLTLVQTEKVAKQIPIILYGTEFWHKAVNMSLLVEWGTISPEDLGLFRFADDIDTAHEYIMRHFKPFEAKKA